MNRLYIVLLFAACLVFGACEYDGQKGIAISEEREATEVKKEVVKEIPQEPDEAKAEKREKEPPEALKKALAEVLAKYKKDAETGMAKAEELIMEEITGLIIEETMTRIGYDFYECFFMFWEAPPGIKNYNILIREWAHPLWGSLVQIEINNTPIWNRILRPRHEEVEDAAKEAVEATRKYLHHYDEYQSQLESRDMVGDGI